MNRRVFRARDATFGLALAGMVLAATGFVPAFGAERMVLAEHFARLG